MKRVKISEQKRFNKEVVEFMEEIGGVPMKPRIDSYLAMWSITTQYGLLEITLPKKHNYCFTVFCKFKGEQEEFRDCPLVNKYSGKLNFHDSVYEIINVFKYKINSIKTK